MRVFWAKYNGTYDSLIKQYRELDRNKVMPKIHSQKEFRNANAPVVQGSYTGRLSADDLALANFRVKCE